MKRTLFFQRPFPHSFYNVTIILIVVNAFVFLLHTFAPNISNLFYDQLALVPSEMAKRGNYWSFVTYLFVHGDFWHILFNMFGLFMFGIPVEQKVGSTEFLIYYFICGILSGVALYLLDPLLGPGMYIGASGAIYAVFLAFVTFFPTATLYIWGILPVKAYILMIGLVAFSIIAQLTGIMGNVSHIGHLAGILVGFLYFVIRFRTNPVKEIMYVRRYYR
jgi:membrane associated rhomboid family serine protease